MNLDLGSSTNVKVKANGGEYDMRFPTVKEAREFQKKTSAASDDEAGEVFIELIASLGMPKDVAEKLDVLQLKKLSEGLLAVAEKK